MQFKRLEILLNVIFWILTSWFIVSTSSIEAQGIEIIDGEKVKTVIRSKNLIYLALSGQFFFLIIFYAEFFLIQQLGNTKKIKAFIFKTIGLLFLGSSLYELTTLLIFPDFDDLDKDIGGILIFYLAVALGYGFIKMWLKDEQDKKQLELVKNQAELNLLKSQLQPHFLFNTMNNLLAMVNQADNPKLAKGIDKLSGLLRYVVYDTKSEKVSIADEISFINNFTELHLLRFEDDEIDFKIKATGTFDTQKIEPGIFLCYVENAFKHGVQPEENAFIHIHIDISKNDTITFLIENTIPKAPFKNETGGFGLQSNQNRLDLAYPDKHKIEFEERSHTYKVKLIINTND